MNQKLFHLASAGTVQSLQIHIFIELVCECA
jgi:hypothetical protein